jgi:hypothetical protein
MCQHDICNQQIYFRVTLCSAPQSFFCRRGCNHDISLRGKNQAEQIENAIVVLQNQDHFHEFTRCDGRTEPDSVDSLREQPG